MAKPKKKPASRLSRFKKWSPEHQARVLQDAGMTSEEFAKAPTSTRRVTVDKGLEAGKQLDSTNYFQNPMTGRQAQSEADRVAGLEYGPQLQANKQLQTNTPAWYQQYIDRTTAAQTAAQAYAAPVLANAQAGITNTATATPGLDPNSPQAALDAQAAKGRGSLAQLGYDTTAAVPLATNAYFAGQQAVAAREQPQIMAGLGQQYGQLQGQQAQASAKAYGDIRTNQQNYGIAQSTLGVNSANMAVDNAQNAADSTQAAADKKAARVVSRKNTRDRVAATGRTQRAAADRAAAKETEKAAEKKTAAKAKKQAAIQKATGGTRTTVADAIVDWRSYVGKQTDDTTKPKDPKTGQYPGRPLKPSEIKAVLGGKDKRYTPGMIHVALMVGAGKPLDKEAIDYLHSTNPDLRIPAEWLRGKKAKTKPRAPGIGHQ